MRLPKWWTPRPSTLASPVEPLSRADRPLTVACVRVFVGGWGVRQGFFFSDYTSKDGQPGDVLIAPSLPGEIVCIPMDGSLEWTIQKGSYLWCVLASPSSRGSPFALR